MAQLGELDFLRRLARAAASTLNATDLLRLVASEASEALGTDTCSVYILDEAATTLTLSATHGLSATSIGRARLKLGEGVTGWAAEQRAPVVIADVREEKRFRWLPGVDQARFVSMCSVPIISGDRLVGALNVQTDTAREFSPADVDLLGAIAAQVAGVIERSELQQRLEARLGELHRTQDIHRRFTQLAIAGATLETICHAIAQYAGVAVAVFDQSGLRLAASDMESMPSQLVGFVDPARRDDDLRVGPIRAGDDALGWFASGPGDDVEPEIRRAALEHGVTVLALELARERSAAEAEQRVRGDLVDELFGGQLAPKDVTRLLRRAALLGHRFQGQLWVLMLEPVDTTRTIAEATLQRMLRRVTDVAASRYPASLVVRRPDSLICLLPGDADLAAAEEVGAEIITATQPLSPDPLTCAISGEAARPGDLPRIAAQARGALAVARKRGAPGVSSHARLGVERLLLDVVHADALPAFVDEWIGPLLRLEEKSAAAAPLTATLHALATEGWNLRAAARALNVHVNTLLYRLQRVGEATGRTMDDPDVRLAMTLALRAHTLVGHLDGPDKRPAVDGNRNRAERLPSVASSMRQSG